jgi:hypothetical protein
VRQNQRTSHELAVCVDNDGYEVSLERLKLYRVVADPEAAKHGQIRVIDESGDDYLYPAALFVTVKLPKAVEEAVLKSR